jgi:hypothetical protein
MAGGQQPRKRKRKGEGETFIMAVDGGELNPRCKACGVVVPLKLWWEHKCQASVGTSSASSTQSTNTGPGSGESK